MYQFLDDHSPKHQFSSATQSYPTFCDPRDCSMPGFPVHHRLLELVQIHVHRFGDTIQPSHPLSFLSPPAFNHSQHQGLFQGVFHIRWSKYWSFSFSISPSNEYSELISFRIDWLDLLAVQGTLKSLLHSSKASILQHSALKNLRTIIDYYKILNIVPCVIIFVVYFIWGCVYLLTHILNSSTPPPPPFGNFKFIFYAWVYFFCM